MNWATISARPLRLSIAASVIWFGDCTACSDIKPRYNKPETRCAESVGMAADLLEAYINELNEKLPKKETPVYDAVPAADIKRVKAMGLFA